MSYIKSNDLFNKIPTEEIFQHIPRPIVIADHLMTPDNIGAMIRLADNIGATEMCFLGNEADHKLGRLSELEAPGILDEVLASAWGDIAPEAPENPEEGAENGAADGTENGTDAPGPEGRGGDAAK